MRALRVQGGACAGLLLLSAACADGPPSSEAPAESPASGSWTCDQSALLVHNVREFPSGAETALLVEDGRIVAFGRDAGDGAPADIRTIDGDGATLLPGLIDAHTHFEALPAAKSLQRELDATRDIFPATFRQTLASGVTTARVHLSTLADMPLLDAIREDACVPAPRIVLSGPGLLGGAPQVDAPLMRGVDGPEDATAKVTELAGLGADWVALHGLSAFTDEELRAVEAAAGRHGLHLLADGDAFEDLSRAAASGAVRSVEYVNRTPATGYPAAVIEAVQAREAPLFVVPPIGYYRRSMEYARTGQPEIPERLLRFFPDSIAAAIAADLPSAFPEDEYVASAIEAFGTFEGKLRTLIDHGLVPVSGTDAGSLGQFHADGIWHEMRAWVALGFGVETGVSSATANAAALLERTDVGTLRSGGAADFVLVGGGLAGEGDLALANVGWVVKGGVVYVGEGEWVGPSAEEVRRLLTERMGRGGSR